MDLKFGEIKSKSFEDQLIFGKEFEDMFSRYLISRGWFVTPKYLFSEKGAPLLIGKNNKYAIPDIDCAKNGKRLWVECKRKSKMKKHPATGYPISNHLCYKKIQEITGDKVYIVFWDESINKYYGNFLDILEKHIYSDNWVFQGYKKHIVFKYPEAFEFLDIDKNLTHIEP